MGCADESGGSCSNKTKAADVTVEKPAVANDRMSRREIMWVLSRKSTTPHCYEISALDLDKGNSDLMEGAKEEDDDDEEDLPKLRKWLREELASKGYVEMYDYCTRRRDELQEFIHEAWMELVQPKIDELSDGDIDWDDDGEDSEDDLPCYHALLRKHLRN